MLTVSEPAAIVNVSPVDTVFGVVRSPYHKQFPDELASQIEIWVSVSPDTFVHVAALSLVTVPDELAPNVTAALVVVVAALLVPDSPGEPVCNFTYTVDWPLYDVALNTRSRSVSSRKLETLTRSPLLVRRCDIHTERG